MSSCSSCTKMRGQREQTENLPQARLQSAWCVAACLCLQVGGGYRNPERHPKASFCSTDCWLELRESNTSLCFQSRSTCCFYPVPEKISSSALCWDRLFHITLCPLGFRTDREAVGFPRHRSWHFLEMP